MKAKNNKSVRFNLRMTSQLYDELKTVADSAGTNVSALVRQGIEWAIKTYGKKNGQVEQGQSETQTEI